jgi:hypothetical protein
MDMDNIATSSSNTPTVTNSEALPLSGIELSDEQSIENLLPNKDPVNRVTESDEILNALRKSCFENVEFDRVTFGCYACYLLQLITAFNHYNTLFHDYHILLRVLTIASNCKVHHYSNNDEDSLLDTYFATRECGMIEELVMSLVCPLLTIQISGLLL